MACFGCCSRAAAVVDARALRSTPAGLRLAHACLTSVLNDEALGARVLGTLEELLLASYTRVRSPRCANHIKRYKTRAVTLRPATHRCCGATVQVQGTADVDLAERQVAVEAAAVTAATCVLTEAAAADPAAVRPITDTMFAVARGEASSDVSSGSAAAAESLHAGPDASGIGHLVAAVVRVAPHCLPKHWFPLFILCKCLRKWRRPDGTLWAHGGANGDALCLLLADWAAKLGAGDKQKKQSEGGPKVWTFYRLHADRSKLLLRSDDAGTCDLTRLPAPLAPLVASMGPAALCSHRLRGRPASSVACIERTIRPQAPRGRGCYRGVNCTFVRAAACPSRRGRHTSNGGA